MKTKVIATRIEDKIIAEVEKAAAKQHATVSWWVKIAIIEKLEREKKKS